MESTKKIKCGKSKLVPLLDPSQYTVKVGRNFMMLQIPRIPELPRLKPIEIKKQKKTGKK